MIRKVALNKFVVFWKLMPPYAATALCTISMKEAEQLNCGMVGRGPEGRGEEKPPQGPAKNTSKPAAGPIAESQQWLNRKASGKNKTVIICDCDYL